MTTVQAAGRFRARILTWNRGWEEEEGEAEGEVEREEVERERTRSHT